MQTGAIYDLLSRIDCGVWFKTFSRHGTNWLALRKYIQAQLGVARNCHEMRELSGKPACSREGRESREERLTLRCRLTSFLKPVRRVLKPRFECESLSQEGDY